MIGSEVFRRIGGIELVQARIQCFPAAADDPEPAVIDQVGIVVGEYPAERKIGDLSPGHGLTGNARRNGISGEFPERLGFVSREIGLAAGGVFAVEQCAGERRMRRHFPDRGLKQLDIFGGYRRIGGVEIPAGLRVAVAADDVMPLLAAFEAIGRADRIPPVKTDSCSRIEIIEPVDAPGVVHRFAARRDRAKLFGKAQFTGGFRRYSAPQKPGDARQPRRHDYEFDAVFRQLLLRIVIQCDEESADARGDPGFQRKFESGAFSGPETGYGRS
ncbi:hypothetical protein SDC9_159632 [bioreactor metagenome]|uniref:Uncharacterized protein n=1 Tax=bioreactor metagenome TaxID=1076179 RepID=A0A645FFD9_9ZZZZ